MTQSSVMRRMPLLRLFISLFLILGGIAAFAIGDVQRSTALRGWTDPTTTSDLPLQLPLAGVNVELTQYDSIALDRELERIAGAGFVWVRQSFLWSEIEAQQGKFDFTKYDPILTAVGKYPTLRVVAVLDSAPKWARRREASAADRLFAPPASMSAFGAFASTFATHFKDQIDYYQLWDEPNLNTHWGGLDPNPADYAAMLKAGYAAIHAADPTSTVIAAGLAPTVERGPRNLSDVLFLQGLYAAGAKDAFDAVAGKPYGFDSGPEDRTVSEDVLNFSHLILLREEMVRQGDAQKALWGSHFGWNSLPVGWTGPQSIWGQTDAETQRRYTRAAYARAAREWPWLGGLILTAWQPLVTDTEAIKGFDVSQKAADWFEQGAFFSAPALGVGLYSPSDPRLKFEGAWRLGPLGADAVPPAVGDPAPDGSDHKLTFSFEGDAVAFTVRRAEYAAYLYVAVDGKPANALPRNGNGDAFILLRTPDFNPRTETIVAARGLGPGVHRVEARLYLGFTKWAIAGIAIGPTLKDAVPTSTNLLIGGGIALIVLGVGSAIFTLVQLVRLPVDTRAGAISNARAIRDYLARMSDVLGGLLISVLALAGVALTLGNFLPGLLKRDLSAFALTVLAAGALYFAPVLILTLVSLALLWVLIFNRPLIGLAFIVFWMPFFLQPVELHIYALPMSELGVYLAGSAILVRTLVDWAGRKRVPAVSKTPNAASRFSAMDGVMLAFVGLAALSLTWSEQLAPAFRELRVIVVLPVVFYGLVRIVNPSRGELLKLVDIFLLSGLVVASIGLVGFFSGKFGVSIAESGSRRLMSLYSSPNNAALFLGRCLPFAAALFIALPRKDFALRKAFAGIVALVLLSALVLTQSAGALLIGIPASLAAVALLWNWRRGLIVVIAMAAILGGTLLLSRFVPRLQGLTDLTRSTSFIRTQVWTSAYNLLRERPLTGAGLDQFLYLYRSRYILPDAWAEPNLSHPHNVILDFWVRLGILGVTILFLFQISFWRSGASVYRRLMVASPRDGLSFALLIGVMGSMVNFLAHGMVDNSYFVIDLAYIFCFSMAIGVQLQRLSRNSR